MYIIRVELLAPHQAPPQVTNRGMLVKYERNRGYKIPEAEQN